MTLKISQSAELFRQAQSLLPGGVDSPVRAFRSVGGQPLFIERGSGPYLYDVDGNRYVDYVLSWGPLILGHAHPAVVEAIRQAVETNVREGSVGDTLHFALGTNIDFALQDATKNLERIRSRLPEEADPPTINKEDPTAMPIYSVGFSSGERDRISLRQ